MAQKWGVTVDDSTLHALTQRLGERAEARTVEQLKTAPQEREPQRAPTKLAVLMLDGWQVRQRGPGWGKKKTKENRGMEDGHRLSIGTIRSHRRRTWGDHPEGGGRVARRPRGVWTPPELGKPCAADWAARRPSWWPAMARPGSGIWCKTAGPGRPKCWIFIMPANTCGNWDGRCMTRRRHSQQSGLNRVATNCGMDGRNNCSRRSPDSKSRAAPQPTWSNASRTILPHTPAA